MLFTQLILKKCQGQGGDTDNKLVVTGGKRGGGRAKTGEGDKEVPTTRYKKKVTRM